MFEGGGRKLYFSRLDVALVVAGLLLTVLTVYAIKTW